MKYSDIEVFRCPKCRASLRFLEVSRQEKNSDSSEVSEGIISCTGCSSTFPVLGTIPRFTDQDGYVDSFGYQWKKFKQTQLIGDQEQINKDRFYEETKWSDNLNDQLVLEAGCGVGRFTEIILQYHARLYSFDLSASVEIVRDNLKGKFLTANYHLFIADIYNIPLPYGMFDKVLCLGVLQHCPDVKRAFLSLVPFLKPGGELVIDCYLRQPLSDMLNPKYLLRPFVKWWRCSWLLAFCKITISAAYNIKFLFVKIPLVGEIFARLIPIGKLNYEPDYHFSASEMKEIKTLSMFDSLSPRYDNPQKFSNFRAWMEEAGLEILELYKGFNGISARTRKRS